MSVEHKESQESPSAERELRGPTASELRKQALQLIAEGHTELASHVNGTKGDLTRALNSLAERLTAKDDSAAKGPINLEKRAKKPMTAWNEYTRSVGIKPGQKLSDEQKSAYQKWKSERK